MKNNRPSVMVGAPGLYTYGVMKIGGVIRDAGFSPGITRDLSKINGDKVFLSLFSTLHLLDPDVKSTVKRVQTEGGKCIIGGPVSSGPEMIMGELHPDFIVCGEGEDAVKSLVMDFDPTECPNCAYMSGDVLVMNENKKPEFNSSYMPLIPEDIGSQDIRGAQTYIETHRGCFGRCGFCQVPQVFGRKIRSREIEDIVLEVKAFKKRGVKRLALIGGTGSLYRSSNGCVNSDAFISLLEEISKIMGPKNVSCPDIRADCITDEVLEAIHTYSVGWIFFGIESGSDKMISIMRKGIPMDKVREAVERCRQAGVRPAGSFITAYPGEEIEDFIATKDLLEELSLDDVFVSVAEPIPGTPLAKEVLSMDQEENLLNVPHLGEYSGLHISEAEARAFDLMLHADICRPLLRMTSESSYQAYLAEAKKQGSDIRNITTLLLKYYS